jgi:hypothetical protein
MHDTKKTFFQATLKSPHCEPVVNEKILCIHCKNALYLNPKSNVVKCLNCRFISSPNNLDWNCNICSQAFKSDVIIYNKCEVNFVKKIINYSLLIKKKARPAKLPCCKNLDLKVTNFYHKKSCSGIIYFAEFHKKLIIICEKCKAVNNFAKFIWTCPQCSLRFKDIKWQENEPKLRKEIFSDKYKLYGDINEEELIRNNRNLNDILKSDFEVNYLIHGKKKKNLYDILKKREDNLPDFKKTEINNAFITDKYIRDNKEFLSTEGSDTKNINYINQDINSENQLMDLIKVKRNNYVQINDINKGQNNINIKKSGEKVDNDLLTTENKKLKKRYIFEKLNRRQFISLNQNALNNLITESKSNKKENKEPKKKISNNNIKVINKINSEILITNQCRNSNNNGKVIVKNRSNNDLNATPLSSKLNKLNVSNVISSETNNLRSRNNKEIISEVKLNNKMMNSIERDCHISAKERKNVIKSNKDKNKSPKENNNINIKKYLFKD